MQREQFQIAGLVKQFGSPAVFLRGSLDVAQHGANVNRLAMIAAVIFVELLHAENFMQRRKNANKFCLLNGLQFLKLSRLAVNFPTQ